MSEKIKRHKVGLRKPNIKEYPFSNLHSTSASEITK